MQIKCSSVTDWALPPFMLCIHLNVSIQVKTLQMETVLTPCGFLDGDVSERAGCVQSYHR